MSISTNLSPASVNPGPTGIASAGALPPSTLARADFEFVANVVHEHAAIEVGPEKEYLVEQRITALARAEGYSSIAILIDRARSETDGRLVTTIVDAMTTNETSFFRDPTVYEFLRAEILPELIERNQATRKLRIWCGAAASGQEPYSLAMLLREHFPEVASSWSIQLIATDLSPTMIERVRQGIYTRIEVNRGLPAAYLVKHFERNGLDWQIHADLRGSVETREVNLSKTLPFAEPFDLIMLRNVLIYFSIDTKRAVLERVRKVLGPGRPLFLGATESTMHIDDSWVRRTYGNVSCYLADH